MTTSDRFPTLRLYALNDRNVSASAVRMCKLPLSENGQPQPPVTSAFDQQSQFLPTTAVLLFRDPSHVHCAKLGGLRNHELQISVSKLDINDEAVDET